MERLLLQVRRAQRRLATQRFLELLPSCLFAALCVAAVAIAAGKIWPAVLGSWMLPEAWIGGAVGVGFLAAALMSIVRSRGQLSAAIELDRRFGLKERVSSTLALAPEDLETPAGKALVDDAVRRLDRLEVSDRFALRMNRRALLPLAPAAVAFALALLVDARGGSQPAEASVTAEKQQVRAMAKQLEKKLLPRREAKSQVLKPGDDLFKRLEEEIKKLARDENADRKKAFVKLNDVSKDLEKRREALEGNKQLREQLKQLKDLKQGPADKLADALKEGNLDQAKNELDKLRQQLAAGKLDADAQKKLADQLQKMQQKLDQARADHEAAKKTLAKEIQRQRSAGQNAAADKLQKQLDKLQKQDSQMSKLSDMASKLGQASNNLKKGNAKQAGNQLAQLSDQLKDTASSLEEMEMIDDSLSNIADAKNSMACKQCQGQGCAACQGQGQGGKKGDKPGDGLGEGLGKGRRPEKRSATQTYESNVPQKVGRGTAVITGFVEGPNRKGEIEQQVKAEFEAAKHEAADPLTSQQLPREHREHAKQYFESLRQGRAQ